MTTKYDYNPGSMSFSMGFLGGFGDRNAPQMKVDEQKARKIIERELNLGRKIERAELGLDGDFNENHTEIFDGQQFYPYDAYGSSNWATPILMIYFEDAPSECHECYNTGIGEAEVSEASEPLQLGEANL